MKRGGRAPRQKGTRRENAVKYMHEAHGIPCERVPLSGSAGGTWAGDLRIAQGDFRGEVKARAKGWPQLERWACGADVVFLVRDARPGECRPEERVLVLLEWETWERLMQEWERGKGRYA